MTTAVAGDDDRPAAASKDNLSRLEYDPALLFNRAQLSIHVPGSPPPSDLPPSHSTTKTTAHSAAHGRNNGAARDNLDGDDVTRRVDEWVTSIARAPEREQAYYDEHVPFYLVVKLPPSPELNRTQALSFLLPSAEAPHLSLTADAAYVEGTYATGTTTPQRSSSLPAGLGLSAPHASSNASRNDHSTRSSSTTSVHSASQGPKVALSPFPVPTMRAQDSPLAADSSVVPLWSTAFSSGEANSRKQSQQFDTESNLGRVWVGQQPDRSWTGVWEFRGPIPYVSSHLMAPKLCLTVTMTFRDDPRIADLLERTSTQAVNGSGNRPSLADILQEEDDYIVESLDDVNLLAGLSASFGDLKLHLPASRLPEPLAPSATSGRRLSRFSLALPGVASNDAPVHPTMRRSARRILDVKSVISVKMRTVLCPVDALIQDAKDNVNWPVDSRTDTRGLVMSVEIEGTDDTSCDHFRVDGIDIKVSPGPAGLGDVEVKRIVDLDTDDTARFPFVVRGGEQHNFLYAVKFTSEAAQQSLTRVADTTQAVTSVPVEVASSPSQRFNARFGDETVPGPNWKADEQATTGNPAAATNAWTRNVSIIVRGQPRTVENRSEGYAVQDSVKTDEDVPLTADTYPTSVFASTWNSVLDISPFAVRTPPKQAPFVAPSQPPAVQLALTAGQKVSADRSSSLAIAKRQSLLQPSSAANFERIAGSKRHTIASLSTLAQKAPAVIRPPTFTQEAEEAEPAQSETNGLSSYFRAPSASASSAASAAARFFSLPSGETGDKDGNARRSLDWSAGARSSTPTTANAPARHFSLPAQASLPPPPPLQPATSSATETKRDNWRQGGAAGVIEHQPVNVLPPAHIPSSGVQTSSGATATSAVKTVPEDNILMSVSLLPLRAVKSGGSKQEQQRQQKKARSSSTSASRERQSFAKFESPSSSSDASEDEDEVADEGNPIAAPVDHSVQGNKWRTPRIGLLDVFLVEVFVLNRSSQVKRFTVGVPVGATSQKSGPSIGPGQKTDGSTANLVALENDVRIGPLTPNSCASVRLRFLAMRPGAHALDELRVVDVATGLETRLREPLWVIVQG
ncbi:hypothetical protein ACM66B_004086 [Microbotryomycetes sp. NB124-2]